MFYLYNGSAMKINDLNFMIGGKAGEGIELPGTMFAKLCMHMGLYINSTAEFYSVIKGYNNITQVRVGEAPVLSHTNDYDLVLDLDKETSDRYLHSIVPGGGLIYDPKLGEVTRDDINLFPVPMREIARDKVGMELAKNIVGLGAVLGLLDYPLEPLTGLIRKTFERKGEEVIMKNHAAAHAGYQYVRENFPREFAYIIKQTEGPKTFMVNGNEAISLGAIKAGCKFVSEYPMTPSSSILHCMARHAQQFDISVNHVEDEIAAINMAVGAGYAGVRSLVGTSGGGFALMTEAVGLAGMLESPVVVVDCQRPGPSTGLPTRTGQGDLRQVLHASQGDFPRIVLSPGTHEEAFYMSFEAFNLAEKYQCPVLMLSEKYLSEGHVNLDYLKTDHLKVDRGKLLKDEEIKPGFKRYEATEDGITNRTIPGQPGGAHTATSYEHDETGYFNEEIEECTNMHARRMKKMDTLLKELPKAKLEGPEGAEVTFVCWGATYGPVLEAMSLLARNGIKANMLHVKYLAPFQPGVRELLEEAKHPILIEGNITAQLGGLIAEKAGVEIQDKILDWSGRPFTAKQIIAETKKLIS